MSEQLYEKASHLLADMNPDGDRTGTIRIPYAYKWPRFQQVEWLEDQALAQNLHLAWARETGLIHRSGELRVTGTEAQIYAFIASIDKELVS